MKSNISKLNHRYGYGALATRNTMLQHLDDTVGTQPEKQESGTSITQVSVGKQ